MDDFTPSSRGFKTSKGGVSMDKNPARYEPPGDLYASTYLHSSVFTFSTAIARGRLLTYNDYYTAILEKQIAIHKSKLASFLAAAGLTEQELLDFLRKGALNPSTTQQAFDKVQRDFMESLTNAAGTESVEKAVEDILNEVVGGYISGHGQQFENVLSATHVRGGSITFDLNKQGTYAKSGAFRDFKKAILDGLASSIGMNREALGALFVGTANSMQLLAAAAALGAAQTGQRGKANVAKALNMSALMNSFNQISYEALKQQNSPQILKYVSGAVDEAVGEAQLNAMAGIYDVLVKNTGTSKFNNKTVKSDLTITVVDPTDGLTKNMGFTVKNLHFFKTKAGTDMFAHTIESGANINILLDKMRSVPGADEDQIQKLKYLIVNFAFLLSAGSLNRKNRATEQASVGDMSAVKQFIVYNINAYMGVIFGMAFTEESNNELMDVGIFYDPSKGIAIPIYVILEQVLGVMRGGGDAVSGDVSFTTAANAQRLLEYHTRKLRSIPAGFKRSSLYVYPEPLVSMGGSQGEAQANMTAYNISIKALKDILNS